jgi:glycosyltransferase involved in cell wall biosynthesis
MDRALPSVRGQTYRNLEIIVAAHGCTDDTVATVERIWDQRIRVLAVPRVETYPPTAENHWLAGPVAPANAALKALKGDYVARIDDDDIWTPDHIAALLDFAQRGNWEFVSAGHETHEGKVEPYDLGKGVLVGGTQTWLYRSYLRFFWNRVNDTDLQDRMFRAGVCMGYLDRVLAFVLPRPGETEIGLKAYQSDRDKKEEEFEFKIRRV